MMPSEILRAMANVEHHDGLNPSHWFPQVTPYLALTWPESGWPEPDMTDSRVMRLLLAAQIAESEGQ